MSGRKPEYGPDGIIQRNLYPHPYEQVIFYHLLFPGEQKVWPGEWEVLEIRAFWFEYVLEKGVFLAGIRR